MNVSSLQSNTFRILLFYAIFVFAVVARPSSSRRLFFPLLCIIYGSILFLPSNTTLLPIIAYQFGLNSLFLGEASDFILLSEPQLQLRKIGQRTPAYELGLKWAMDLIFNSRGVNWSWEAPGLRRSSLTGWSFVKSQLKREAFYYILNDALAFYMRHNAAFSQDDSLHEEMGTHGLVWQAWNVMVYWSAIYTFMQFSYILASVLSTSMGQSQPSEWPEWFGPLAETTTVRKFWGRTWHQSVRRMVSAHGQYLAYTVLHLQKGTFPSAYVQLYTAFFVSGLAHGTGDFAATHSIHSFTRNIVFFVLQAVAITVEDVVIGTGKKLGIKKVPWLVGYLWILCWFAWSSPIWFETLIRGRLIEFRPPYSCFDAIFFKS
ncbi:membrane bound O-acyl transferase family-domain-containing protein [Flammula alnicola]|nr:membrane bound O-acyl transferase family-domain-containing protein [Flammula alnicola]